MKTLLFTTEYPPFKGGVADYYEKLVKYWPETGRISVLDNQNHLLLSKFFYPNWLKAFFALWKIIVNERIDQVIVGQILPLGTVTYSLSKLMKFKYSLVIHGMDIKYAYKVRRKRQLAEKILKGAHKIICVNSHTADFIRINFDKLLDPKIFVVNPGIDTDLKINRARAEELKIKYRIHDKPLIFSIGRLVKRKGFDNMLKALPEVQKYYPNLFYVLAGDGPDKEYIKKQGKGLKNVLFLGKISEEDKWAWLSLCDIFAMPSREIAGDVEGFGIVYLEAGLCGRAVLGGKSGGIGDAVIPAITGVLVQPENIEKIANYTLMLLKNSNERKTMGRAARERVLKDFNAPEQVQKFYNVLMK